MLSGQVGMIGLSGLWGWLLELRFREQERRPISRLLTEATGGSLGACYVLGTILCVTLCPHSFIQQVYAEHL